jgi:hypothetical protein
LEGNFISNHSGEQSLMLKLLFHCRVLAVALGTLSASIALALADGELRTWSDATGKFKIEARFVSQYKSKVTLKDKDGKLFEIETTKLGAEDQKHRAELAKMPMAEDPFKPVATGPDWSGSRQVEVVAGPEWKVAINPAADASFKSAPVALPARLNFWESCSALVVNPASRKALVGYQWNVHNAGKNVSRMLYCDLESGKILGQTPIDGLVTPIALDDEGTQGIVKRTVGDRDHIEFWSLGEKGLAKTKELIPADPKNRGRDVRWAVFLDKKRLLTASYAGGMVVLWDLPTLKPIWHILTQPESVSALAPDRKHVAFISGANLGMLDVDAGKVIAMRPIPTAYWPSLAFSPGGKWLACGASDHVYVWNVATGELHRDHRVNALDVWGTIAWPNDSMMLTNNKWLMDADLGFKYWEYKGHNHVQVHGTQGWFVTHDNNSGVIAPAAVPGPVVQEAIDKASADIVLKPGAAVKLDATELPHAKDREKAAKSLTDQLAKKGYKVDGDAKLELLATTDVGKTVELNFIPSANDNNRPWMPAPPRLPGSTPPKLPPGTKVRTVTMEQHFSRLKLVLAGKTVWELSADNLPKKVQLEEGQTLEQHLKKLERPNYAFYDTVDLPRVLHRTAGLGPVGSSTVTISGVR